MFGKLLKPALIAPVAALLLMLAAPVAAPAANADRDGTFGYPGWVADQQERWQDRQDGRRHLQVGWRSDRHDRWSDRRDDRRDRWNDRRYRRHQWRQDRWRSRWDRWDRRAGSRRHRHPHGHRWHPHRY